MAMAYAYTLETEDQLSLLSFWGKPIRYCDEIVPACLAGVMVGRVHLCRVTVAGKTV